MERDLEIILAQADTCFFYIFGLFYVPVFKNNYDEKVLGV